MLLCDCKVKEVSKISKERTIALQIDEAFHREIKIRLAENGKTLKGYIIDLIKADLDSSKKTEQMPDKLDRIIEILQKIAEK